MVTVADQPVYFSQIYFVVLDCFDHRKQYRLSVSVLKCIHISASYNCVIPIHSTGMSRSSFNSLSSLMTVSVAPIISREVK